MKFTKHQQITDIPLDVQTALNPEQDYVGLDCLSLPENFSGAAYYIYHLTKNMLQAPRRFRVVVLCKPSHADLFYPLLAPGDRLIKVKLDNRMQQLFFYEFKLRSLLVRERIKVFYATHYLCPPSDPRYTLICTFHDMGFLLHPQYYQLHKRIYFGTRMRTFLNRANVAVAVSESTGKAMARLFPQHAQKIHVCYPGIDHLTCNKSYLGMGEPHDRPFILAVNTFEKRKNIHFIVKIFNHLKQFYHFDHKLILVGHPANGFKKVMQKIERSPYRADIIVENSIPIDRLNYYYKNCDFFINVSEYEGFGFTPLEAIGHGCPVFLYRNNTVAEILGDHPYILYNLEVEEWLEVIVDAYQNGFRHRLTPKRIEHLTWQNAAASISQLCDRVITEGKISLVS